MTILLTQNLAIINMDNITSIYIDKTEDDRIILAADQKYILGWFYTKEDAIQILLYITNAISEHADNTNLNIVIPQADKVDEVIKEGGDNNG